MSLLLCAGSLVLGVRSIWRSSELQGHGPLRLGLGYYSMLAIRSHQGVLSVLIVLDPLDGEDTDAGRWEWIWGDWPAAQDASANRLSWRDQWFKLWIIHSKDIQFASGTPPGLRRGGDLGLNVPYWSLALSTALLPACWALAKLRRHRRLLSDNRCRRCGYDLRASPARCPECGQPTPSADDRKRSRVAAKDVAATQSPKVHLQ